jgi:hypothetical protein
MVAAATYTENLTIPFSLRLVGSAASTTIIDGGRVNTVVRIFNTEDHVALSRVTVRNGRASVRNCGLLYLCAEGGGIYNSGTLTVIDSTITGNVAFEHCMGSQRCLALGGGIYNDGTLTISKSTIMGNFATARCNYYCSDAGGGISNHGTLTINNSTISGNMAESGGGLDNAFTLTINNSTISGNLAESGGGLDNAGTLTINNSTISGNMAERFGGMYFLRGTATLQNSIVANNPRGNCGGGRANSKGYNLSSDNTCDFDSTGDLNNTDPKLGPLQNNGGPTRTQALLHGSPAIDAGNPSGCTDGKGHLLKTDQRGKPRPDKEDTGGCDMGAYKRQQD